MSLGFPLKEAQVHFFDSLNPGLGSVGLGRIESSGPVFSFGSSQNLGSDVAFGGQRPKHFSGSPGV